MSYDLLTYYRVPRRTIKSARRMTFSNTMFEFDHIRDRLRTLESLKVWLHTAGFDLRYNHSWDLLKDISSWAGTHQYHDEPGMLSVMLDPDTRPANCWFDVIEIRYCHKSIRKFFVIEGRFS